MCLNQPFRFSVHLCCYMVFPSSLFFNLQCSELPKLPLCVKIVEVGPRDGLQTEKVDISHKTLTKLFLFTEILITRQIITVSTNLIKCFPLKVEVGATEVAVLVSASEIFSRKNINSKREGIPVCGYVSCALGCPYEGQVKPSQVTKVAKQLFDLGCYEVSLGDTVGVGTADSMAKMLSDLLTEVPLNALAVHSHSPKLWNNLPNIVREADTLCQSRRLVLTSVAGLVGCLYAKGASGNVSTEDILYMKSSDAKASKGVDLLKVMEINSKVSQATETIQPFSF
uniref:hydroxymethylglutaryl-CoA lyase n=1 Tax=Cyprinus carpio TaxID=7962 RepID=A0A8C2DCZ0_CYPCA